MYNIETPEKKIQFLNSEITDIPIYLSSFFSMKIHVKVFSDLFNN